MILARGVNVLCAPRVALVGEMAEMASGLGCLTNDDALKFIKNQTAGVEQKLAMALVFVLGGGQSDSKYMEAIKSRGRSSKPPTILLGGFNFPAYPIIKVLTE
jgi:hypothetical protein